MVQYVIRRLLWMIPTLIGVSLLTPASPKEKWEPFFEQSTEGAANGDQG